MSRAVIAVAILCLSVLLTVSCAARPDKISARKSLVWGSAIREGVVVPTSYVYIQARNAKQENITTVSGVPFTVRVDADGRLVQQPAVQPVGDGVFLAKWRWATSIPQGVAVSVQLDTKNAGKLKHVAQSPYVVAGPILTEECSCPYSTIEEFSAVYECSDTYGQIDADFSEWPATITMEHMDRVPDELRTDAVVRYVIKENRVYRKLYGKITDFKRFSDAIVRSITRKVKLPDLDFYMNLGDWPLVTKDRRSQSMFRKKKSAEEPLKSEFLPMISWCGTSDTYDTILPTYKYMNPLLGAMRSYNDDLLSMESAAYSSGGEWSERTEKLFFRGRDSNRERMRLSETIRDNPTYSDYADVKISMWNFHPRDESITSERVPFVDFFKYKYQLNIDGTVAAYRLGALLSSGSAVFKQSSKYYEHYYHLLGEYRHFVPVNESIHTEMGDLVEKVRWARENDEEIHAIARRARDITRYYLSQETSFCYHVRVLQEYAKRIAYKVSVLEGMEEVLTDDVANRTYEKSPCPCNLRSGRVKVEL